MTEAQNSERKLSTVRIVSDIIPIEGADRIVQYKVDGWKVIDKKGKYEIGDMVIYLEVDSWVKHELAPFLSKGKEPKEYNGVKGERLKTIKIKGVLSQGLLLDPSQFNRKFELGECLDEYLGIIKYDPPEEVKSANAKGTFPAFIPKTDQPRIQNIKRQIEDAIVDNLSFEVTEKLHGSSMTVYLKDSHFGICSRNLELKLDEDSAYLIAARNQKLEEKLRSVGRNLAIQGELIGTGINGNNYKINGFEFYCFDVFDIDKQEYLSPSDRVSFITENAIKHVPVLASEQSISELGSEYNDICSKLLDVATAKTVMKSSDVLREGLVFKSHERNKHSDIVHFKVISNEWLLKYE